MCGVNRSVYINSHRKSNRTQHKPKMTHWKTHLNYKKGKNGRHSEASIDYWRSIDWWIIILKIEMVHSTHFIQIKFEFDLTHMSINWSNQLAEIDKRRICWHFPHWIELIPHGGKWLLHSSITWMQFSQYEYVEVN